MKSFDQILISNNHGKWILTLTIESQSQGENFLCKTSKDWKIFLEKHRAKIHNEITGRFVTHDSFIQIMEKSTADSERIFSRYWFNSESRCLNGDET